MHQQLHAPAPHRPPRVLLRSRLHLLMLSVRTASLGTASSVMDPDGHPVMLFLTILFVGMSLAQSSHSAIMHFVIHLSLCPCS